MGQNNIIMKKQLFTRLLFSFDCLHYFCGMKNRKQSGTIEDAFNKFVDGYQPKPFISSEWPLENGIYKQYSAFEESGVSVSGTANSLKLI